MKYKNINSAIHNFGHSFTSLMNYVDDAYVIDDLTTLHEAGISIEINWLTREFSPADQLTMRIRKSIDFRASRLREDLLSQDVVVEKLRSLVFRWPAGKRKIMEAIDDRGKVYKIHVNEVK